jgi:hypothetical protein
MHFFLKKKVTRRRIKKKVTRERKKNGDNS